MHISFFITACAAFAGPKLRGQRMDNARYNMNSFAARTNFSKGKHVKISTPDQRIANTRQQLSTATTSLGLMNPSTAGAATALIGPSVLGFLADRQLPNCGIAVTLIAAAILSNSTPLIPSSHSLYDICWSVLLPASLTLQLLSYQAQEETMKGIIVPPSVNDNDDDGTSTASCIRRVSLPFLLASLGSLLGCLTSFHCSRLWNWFPLENARAATACLSASYVGGSANFFATARLIGANSELVGSLATAELFTMSFYFAALTLSLNWIWLQSKFFTRNTAKSATETVQDAGYPVTLGGGETFGHSSAAKFLAAIPLLGTTFVLVKFANLAETYLGRYIPGTACAMISLTAPVINSLVNRFKWWRPFSEASSLIADLLFLSFFAAIGVGSNMQLALQMGPPGMLFSFLALLVHLIFVVAASLPFSKGFHIELEDVWIASNAAVGGPATAAAFCKRLGNPEKLRGRTKAATVVGVGELEMLTNIQIATCD
eukprot:scaffold333_cov133-Cylindrotheca_fusiformis.AAC.45